MQLFTLVPEFILWVSSFSWSVLLQQRRDEKETASHVTPGSKVSPSLAFFLCLFAAVLKPTKTNVAFLSNLIRRISFKMSYWLEVRSKTGPKNIIVVQNIISRPFRYQIHVK